MPTASYSPVSLLTLWSESRPEDDTTRYASTKTAVPRLRSSARVESSAVNVAGEGFRLSLLLNAAACHIAQSGIEIHSIAKGVSLFSLALKQLGQALQAPGSNHSREAVDKTWEIADQGERIFIEIEQMLNKLKGTDTHGHLKTLPLQQRVKWCFKRHHVTYLLAQLESLKLSLMVILQTLRLGSLINTKRYVLRSFRLVTSLTDPRLSDDDAIAQEKAEAQNMIIVRYWAAKRLNRLWELVEQETQEAEDDPTDQLINSHYLSLTKTPVSWARSTKLPVPSFGDGDVGLGPMEQTPKDMVQLSERVLNQLLSIWVLDLEDSSSSADSKAPHAPKVHFSSDSDTSDDVGSDGHEIRGYYLEGPTVNWRQPHSQEARNYAARLRKKYSKYQPHVESDSEDTESPKPRRESPITGNEYLKPEDDGVKKGSSQRSQPGAANMSNIPSLSSSHSFESRHPSFTQQSPTYPASYPYPSSYSPSYPPPGQQPPKHPPPRSWPQQPSQPQEHNIPRSQPVKIPSTIPPRIYPPSQFKAHKKGSPRFSTPPQYLSPTQHYSSDSSRSHNRSPPRQRRARENKNPRHRSFTESAAKGLIGAGAIAGFMDALEAFSL